jgi:hypothetical protein
MRPLRLARLAAEAEGVRLRAMAARMVTRIVLAVLSLVFVLAALAFAHAAAWYWLRVGEVLPFYQATGIVGGADLLIALILGLIATRSGPGRVEREALAVRRQAVMGIGKFLTISELALPALRIAAGMRRRRRRA